MKDANYIIITGVLLYIIILHWLQNTNAGMKYFNYEVLRFSLMDEGKG